MTTEIIKVGEESHEIEVRPITLIYTSPDLHERLSYPSRIPLGTEETEYHISRVQKFHPTTAQMVAHVFGIKDVNQVNPDWCRQAGSGIRHIAGLLDLSLKMCQMGVPFVWIHPESFLHPKAQCQLGDILLWFINDPPRTNAEIEESFMEHIAIRLAGDPIPEEKEEKKNLTSRGNSDTVSPT